MAQNPPSKQKDFGHKSPSHSNSQNHSQNAQVEALEEVIQTVHRLRAPDGCPWDRAQTHQSLRQYLIEEAYEVLDVLDKIRTPQDLQEMRTRSAFQEELGDLLLQILLHSEMASEHRVFDIYSVARGLNEKLIRRHPHVFGDQKVDSEESAFQRWEQQKAKEKASNPDPASRSVLSGVPRGLPALQKTARVIEKVSKVGFQWKDLGGPLEKVEEELTELRDEIQKVIPDGNITEKIKEKKADLKKIEAELGDLLFSLCNLAYLLKLSPEDALRGTLHRFENRFRHVERKLHEEGKSPEQSDLARMDQLWEEAKKLEKVQVWGLTGGIGSGKSTVAGYFAENGIPVIDADVIGKELLENNREIQEAVLRRFGTSDRSALREVVFRDLQAKQDLEKILHPQIALESQKRILQLADQHSIVLYEAALLVETGRYSDFAGLIVVEAPEDLRLERITTHRKINAPLAKQILDSQLTNEEQRIHATILIENSGNLEDLRQKVSRIIVEQGWVTRFTK